GARVVPETRLPVAILGGDASRSCRSHTRVPAAAAARRSRYAARTGCRQGCDGHGFVSDRGGGGDASAPVRVARSASRVHRLAVRLPSKTSWSEECRGLQLSGSCATRAF